MTNRQENVFVEPLSLARQRSQGMKVLFCTKFISYRVTNAKMEEIVHLSLHSNQDLPIFLHCRTQYQ